MKKNSLISFIKKFWIWVVLFVTMFLLTITTTSAQYPEVPPPDYFPLPVGAVWNYESTSHTGGKSNWSQKVLQLEKQPDGSFLYQVEISSGFPIQDWYSKPPGWVLMHKELYVNNKQEAVFQPTRQYLRNPLAVADTWKWQGTGMNQIEISESSQVAAAEEVNVPAGKFQAMKVVTDVIQGGALVKKTYWYVNHLGLVKSMTDSNGVQSTSVLLSYSFPK
ncbi:MAG: hypothetical protein ACRC8A_02955 [Microcoleaceae cyanobacterium]